MKTSKASAALWGNANKRTAAQHGLPGSDPADGLHPVITIPQLIKSIGVNPDALELLAARQHEMTPEQRTAALRAGLPPKARKVAKAQPKATPPAARRFANIPLRGFNRGAGL